MKIRATYQDTLSARLRELPGATSHQVQTEALIDGAEPIRAEAERRAPRRTGELATHVIVDAYTESELERGLEFGHEEAAVAVGPDRQHFYGYFDEFGTVHQPARPWFRPSVDQKSSTALNIVLGRLWDAIRAFCANGATSARGNAGGIGSRNL